MVSGIPENPDFSFPNPEDQYLSGIRNTNTNMYHKLRYTYMAETLPTPLRAVLVANEPILRFD
jgi:hypothetical protein